MFKNFKHLIFLVNRRKCSDKRESLRTLPFIRFLIYTFLFQSQNIGVDK